MSTSSFHPEQYAFMVSLQSFWDSSIDSGREPIFMSAVRSSASAPTLLPVPVITCRPQGCRLPTVNGSMSGRNRPNRFRLAWSRRGGTVPVFPEAPLILHWPLGYRAHVL